MNKPSLQWVGKLHRELRVLLVFFSYFMVQYIELPFSLCRMTPKSHFVFNFYWRSCHTSLVITLSFMSSTHERASGVAPNRQLLQRVESVHCGGNLFYLLEIYHHRPIFAITPYVHLHIHYIKFSHAM